MITEETKKKFEQIFRTMTPDQRATLQAHLMTATEDQKWDIIEKIVKTYESRLNNPFVQSELNPSNEVSYEPAEEVPYEESFEQPVQEETNRFVAERPTPAHTEYTRTQYENRSTEERPVPKRKLKKGVKNGLTAIVLVLILGVTGIIAYTFRDTIFPSDPDATTVTYTEPSITETTAAPTATPTVTPTPEPTRVPLAADAPDLTGLTVVLDPGHQETADTEQELYASWLSATKPRCTAGAEGVVTGTPEYELTLDYSLIIADYLEQCGANVILTRDTNDVNISNQERAQIAVSNNADVFLRIHADAAGDSAASGVRVYIPDNGSYTDTSPAYAEQLAELVADAEGLEVNEVRATSLYTGLNYANTIRAFQLSLGFLSNSDDETVLVNEENIARVAEAVAVFCAEFTE